MQLQPTAKRFLDKTMVCAQILKNILITIMDSKKLETSPSAVHLTQTPTEMRKFIEEISLLCKDLVQGSGIRYILNISPSFPQRVLFDRDRLSQVILNLVSNAIKFTQKGFVSLSFEWKSSATAAITAKPEDLIDVEERVDFFTAIDSKFQEIIGMQKKLLSL